MTTDKNGLLAQLKHQETSLSLTFGMIALVQIPTAMLILKGEKVYVTDQGVTNIPGHDCSGFTFDFVNCEGLAAFCNQKGEGPIKEFLKSSFRNLITVSWELVWKYCRATQQDAKLTNQPWYQFFRIIRNSLSHDFTFNVPKDKSGEFISATWRDCTITGVDHGKLIPLSFLGWDGLWELYLDFHAFVENDLS
ncbi:hypothetical protein DET47_1325 [Shewanella putrefaciens]|nr:hypothetical protein DET47_1325 [Shewanella putrefaciens]